MGHTKGTAYNKPKTTAIQIRSNTRDSSGCPDYLSVQAERAGNNFLQFNAVTVYLRRKFASTCRKKY